MDRLLRWLRLLRWWLRWSLWLRSWLRWWLRHWWLLKLLLLLRLLELLKFLLWLLRLMRLVRLLRFPLITRPPCLLLLVLVPASMPRAIVRLRGLPLRSILSMRNSAATHTT
jgi:hypothetical protein